jgi:hypothetical protein
MGVAFLPDWSNDQSFKRGRRRWVSGTVVMLDVAEMPFDVQVDLVVDGAAQRIRVQRLAFEARDGGPGIDAQVIRGYGVRRLLDGAIEAAANAPGKGVVSRMFASMSAEERAAVGLGEIASYEPMPDSEAAFLRRVNRGPDRERANGVPDGALAAARKAHAGAPAGEKVRAAGEAARLWIALNEPSRDEPTDKTVSSWMSRSKPTSGDN